MSFVRKKLDKFKFYLNETFYNEGNLFISLIPSPQKTGKQNH